MYHYSNSHPVSNYATQSAPFIYVGDGSVKEYGKFKLGTTSYLPVDANMTYRDMRTGEIGNISLYDAAENRSSQVYLSNKYTWDGFGTLRPRPRRFRLPDAHEPHLREGQSGLQLQDHQRPRTARKLYGRLRSVAHVVSQRGRHRRTPLHHGAEQEIQP